MLLISSCLLLLGSSPSHFVSADFYARSSTNIGSDILKAQDEHRAEHSSPSSVSSIQGAKTPQQSMIMGSPIAIVQGIPMARLHNGDQHMPLVGLGVGNMQHHLITEMVAEAMQNDKQTRMFDTAMAAQNEGLIAAGINQGVERMNWSKDEPVQVHIVTKVWYTHLGYERTKFAVEQTMENYKTLLDNPKVDLKIHLLVLSKVERFVQAVCDIFELLLDLLRYGQGLEPLRFHLQIDQKHSQF